MRHRFLPLRSPVGRTGWYRLVGDRPLTHLGRDQDAAADEAETAVVEIVALEIGDDRAETARTHEQVEDVPFVIEERHIGCGTVPGIVLADHALAARRIVRPA